MISGKTHNFAKTNKLRKKNKERIFKELLENEKYTNKNQETEKKNEKQKITLFVEHTQRPTNRPID